MKNKFTMKIGIEVTSIEASKRLIQGLAAIMNDKEKAQFVKIVEKKIKRVTHKLDRHQPINQRSKA